MLKLDLSEAAVLVSTSAVAMLNETQPPAMLLNQVQAAGIISLTTTNERLHKCATTMLEHLRTCHQLVAHASLYACGVVCVCVRTCSWCLCVVRMCNDMFAFELVRIVTLCIQHVRVCVPDARAVFACIHAFHMEFVSVTTLH